MGSHQCRFSPSPDSNLRPFCPSTEVVDTPVSADRRNSDVFMKLSVSVHFLFVEVTLQRAHVTDDAPFGPRDSLEKWRGYDIG